MTNLKFVYFGGEPLGVAVLEELKKKGLQPNLIITSPDKPKGRGQKLTAPAVKDWGIKHNLPVWQPEDFKDEAGVKYKLEGHNLFVVVAYGKILPTWLLNLPKFGSLNLHPSLLPLYRGASPIRSAILEDNKAAVGVSIILMDEKMDHGPILKQQTMTIADKDWPPDGRALDKKLARLGGAVLASIIPDWVAGLITPTKQNHAAATYCSKFEKSLGELKLNPYNLPSGREAKRLLHKIRALADNPGTFFRHNGRRIKVTKAELTPTGTLVIQRIIPAGKAETDFNKFFQP